jgi:hypothetical protein
VLPRRSPLRRTPEYPTPENPKNPTGKREEFSFSGLWRAMARAKRELFGNWRFLSQRVRFIPSKNAR